MRRVLAAIVVFAAVVPALFGRDIPALAGRVNDYADMISPAAEQAMEQKLEALEASDSTQVVVLTIPSLEGEDMEGFSIRVADAWKIGTKEHDNGAILLVSRDDHLVRIEVGYGLEGKLTDLVSGRIIRGIITPAFKAGRFDEGFTGGTDAIIATVKGEYQGTGQLPGAKTEPVSVVPLLLTALFVSGALGSRRRILGGIAGGVLMPLASLIAVPVGWLTAAMVPLGFGGGLLAALLFASRRRGWGGPSGFGRGGFGGFTGGGFPGGGSSSGGGFSGGGGGFGGGGATGRW